MGNSPPNRQFDQNSEEREGAMEIQEQQEFNTTPAKFQEQIQRKEAPSAEIVDQNTLDAQQQQ